MPQFHADSTVQLNEPGLQMHRLALGVIKVDGCALVVVALNLRQVHSQVVTQLTEFGLPGVLEAEFDPSFLPPALSFTFLSWTQGHEVPVH